MVLRLTDALDVPLRERNAILLAAGYAPVFAERKFEDASMAMVRSGVDRLLSGYEPFPALALDRHWNIIAANRMIAPMIAGVAEHLTTPPINALRLSLHPEGLAPRIENLSEWRTHLLARLDAQRDQRNDAELDALYHSLKALPGGIETAHDANAVAVALRLRTASGTLSFLSATMVFGAPLEVTLSELAIEVFLPADSGTEAALNDMRPS